MSKAEDAARFGEEILQLLLKGEHHSSLDIPKDLFYSKYIRRCEDGVPYERCRWRVTQEGKDLLL